MRDRLRSESVRSGVNNKLSSLASKNNKRQFGTFSDAGASEPKGWLHQTEAAELSFFPPFAHSVNAHRVSTPHLALSSLALCSRVPTLLSLSLSLSHLAPRSKLLPLLQGTELSDRSEAAWLPDRTDLSISLSVSVSLNSVLLIHIGRNKFAADRDRRVVR